MKILLVGGGGREHALAWKILQSPKVTKLFVAPGNGGTSQIAENVDIKPTDLKGILNFLKNNPMDLVIVTPDDPLAMGMVDKIQEMAIPVWGPVKAAAQIEWSKSFSKNLMAKNDIPTAEFKVFNNFDEALSYIKEKGVPLVIKASGLALGKGVYVCKGLDEAEQALREMMLEKKFGDAGADVVIEEFLEGQEISIHAFCDGLSFKSFPTSQDHKTIFDGDQGPNTGGIGAIAPVPWVSPELIQEIEKTVVSPALSGMATLGTKFIGCLYPGLMITKNGPKVLEFNARFGDPEAEVYMRLLETDLLQIIEASLEGRLSEFDILWRQGFAASVVLTSAGYPGEYKKGLPISGLAEAQALPGVVVFHSGTKYDRGELLTNGGRVLNVTAVGATLQEALDKTYQAVNCINFEGMHYRKDIGRKSL